mmetsp:Transcript_18171/g.52949  ORF Transcript_18171/g.52949 Transcript_18171/m.52949 type:complete len:299 (+) Transcript_18171:73-969(+)
MAPRAAAPAPAALLAFGARLLLARAAGFLPDDSSALLQSTADVAQSMVMQTAVADIMRPKSVPSPVDCQAYPALCRAPFNCKQGDGQQPDLTLGTPQDKSAHRTLVVMDTHTASSSGRYATQDGHSNMNWFCGSQEQFAMLECATGNLSGYGLIKSQERPRNQGNLVHRTIHEVHHDMLAQYCFNMGHCNDKEVSQGMTMLQGEAMCDKKYGHKAWANFTEGGMETSRFLSGLAGTLKVDLLTSGSLAKVTLGKPSAKTMGKMACAEGHFHCDVLLCKEHYCQDEGYWKKYHHRLPKL